MIYISQRLRCCRQSLQMLIRYCKTSTSSKLMNQRYVKNVLFFFSKIDKYSVSTSEKICDSLDAKVLSTSIEYRLYNVLYYCIFVLICKSFPVENCLKCLFNVARICSSCIYSLLCCATFVCSCFSFWLV